jgi:hypothetical protein
MKIISHRGNINGPVPEKENRPSYIDCAIQLGYEVEVDLRYINGEFWLGHDLPQYRIELSWMALRKDKIWFHCKDQESSIKLLEIDEKFKFFCHNQDSFVLTSTAHIWVHDLSNKINDKCIIPLLSIDDIKSHKVTNEFGVCSDYVKLIKNVYPI